MSVYEKVNCKELLFFAEKAGLGGRKPADLKQFITFIKKDARILEVGCGTGRIGKYLLKNFDYVGIDNFKPYLEDFLKKVNNKEGSRLRLCSFENYRDPKKFDVIIFPWTVIGDFKKGAQARIIKKAHSMLKKGGLILIDNPARGTVYNRATGYAPAHFYFDDWKERLEKIFSKSKCILYDTPAKRKRELVILEK